jgi:hypothetical protein
MNSLPKHLMPLVLLILWNCQPATQDDDQGAENEISTQTTSNTEGEWIVLFDGQNADAWRDFKGETLSWKVENGELTTDGEQGDIITQDTYQNYELVFEWKIERGGNSGVIYNVVEDDKYGSTYETGPEYQLIDAENYKEVHDYELQDSQVTAANYALHVPSSQPTKPAGAYNLSKIVVNEGQVEHWLNGEKVVSYELWSPEWVEKVAQTKFKNMPDYGKAKSGHIALQGHGDAVWFKEIKIREL